MFSVDWGRPEGKWEMGGSCWWREVMPGTELQKHGYDIVTDGHKFESAPDGHLRILDTNDQWHDDCDVIVMQRWMGQGGAAQVLRARAAGQIIIQDLDDDYWALPKNAIGYKNADPKLHPEWNRAEYKATCRASDAIICSTQKLANNVERWGPTVYICRNAIDIENWKVRNPNNPGCIGWVGSLPWRDNDLGLLRESVVPWLEDHDLPFYHGGHVDDPAQQVVSADQTIAQFARRGVKVVAQQRPTTVRVPSAAEQLGYEHVLTKPLVPMSQYTTLWDHIATAVIPIMRTEFNLAKSWCKGLEACAKGIPFIASRMPEYELLGAGRLVDKGWQWADHLDELMDPKVRAEEGARNRLRAEELSIGNQWHQWDSVFSELTAHVVAA